MMVNSTRRRQILGLDLLRLMAASLVMLYHFSFWHWTKGGLLHPLFASGPSPNLQLHFGWVGVEIFFVLSGFVISYSAYGSTPFQFFRSRTLRLIPGVWVCATLSLIAMAAIIHEPTQKMVVDYVCTLIFWPFKAIDNVYWTLDIEVAFYAVVGVLISLKKLAMLETLMLMIAAVGGVFWVIALTMAGLLDHATGAAGLIHTLVLKAEGTRILQLLLVQHGSFFALGVVIQRAVIDGFTSRRRLALTLIPIACLLEIAGQNSIISRAAGVQLSPIPAAVAWLCAMGLLILAIAGNDFILDRMKHGQRFVRFLGRSTYPFYLIHNTIIFCFVAIFSRFLGVYSIIVGFAGAYLAAFLIEAGPEKLLREILSRTPLLTKRPELSFKNELMLAPRDQADTSKFVADSR